MRRVFLIVLDSVGIGALPDAAAFGDVGANTLGNLAWRLGHLNLPHMGRLGLGDLVAIPGTPPAGCTALGSYGKLALASPGKDTTTGHWEMVGIRLAEPLRTYPQGFPAEVIRSFLAATGLRGVLGNEVASGTEIIDRLGAEHIRTGWPIVYTSADSVFQVAAHEDVIPVDRLYEICLAARRLLSGPHQVGRVIARPFAGAAGAFRRTERRRDFSLPPPPNLLGSISGAGLDVTAVGKISDIFDGHGISRSVKTRDNTAGMAALSDLVAAAAPGLVFANLVDFDQTYGHRRDAAGYARALAAFDAWLPGFQQRLVPGDIAVITADHGNDPTFRGTDHTREYVPALIYGTSVRTGWRFATRRSLADLGATVAEWLDVASPPAGTSFLPEVVRPER